MSYSGLVTRIKVRPHPNADKLAIGQCGPYQVVISKDTPDMTMGVFFAVDGQLSEAFVKEHDLISRTEVKPDPNDPTKTIEVKAGGYFGNSRKVKCQKLRGEKSEGFWMPITCLAFTGVCVAEFKEGDEITSVNGIEICRKYLTPATLKAIGNRSTKPVKQNKCFAKHLETGQFKREGRSIPTGAVLYVTAKLHGTSHRTGYVMDTEEIKLPLVKRLLNKIYPFFATEKKEYKYLNGSRNVVLEKNGGTDGYYGNDGFRFKMTDPLKGLLNKNEVIYGEIVGYTTSGSPIMGSMPVKDKEQQKIFGKTMEFSYGNEKSECSMYIYRITTVNEDGIAVDLSYPQMCKRCEQLGLKVVPLLIDPFVYDGDLEKLTAKLTALLEKPSVLDSRHVEEGVCIRWDGYPICNILKYKSFTFLGLEDEQKSDAEYVDQEEAA